MILLNPGPVNLSTRVRNALLRPDMCHREPEFGSLQSAIRGKLLDAYALPEKEYAAVLVAGSGTAAVEAMVTSIIPHDRQALILANGVYGERIAKITEIYKIPHRLLRHDWNAACDLHRLEEELRTQPKVSHVIVVHHETTTGRLNALEDIGRLCTRYDVPLLVDGVSSFGAEELKFTEWNIAACAATANKCLHGVPGTSFIIVRRDQLGKVRRNLYLDLSTYCQLQDQSGTPFTQPVQTFYALNEALDEFGEEGGWPARHAVYAQRMTLVQNGARALGIELLIPAEHTSVVLSAFRLPANLPYQQLHDRLKQRGFVIYAGQGDMTSRIFRVSVMGAITLRDMDRFYQALSQILPD